MVPPIPHYPHRELSVAVTASGLVIKATAQSNPKSYARVRWGVSAVVEEVAASAISPKPSWNDAPTIFGIVGIIRLYHGSYLLVIASHSEVGEFLDRSVYAVKGVVAIPLTESAASATLNSLAARGPLLGLSRGPDNVAISDLSDVASDDEYPSSLSESDLKRVELAHQVPSLVPEATSSSSPDPPLGLESIAKPNDLTSPPNRSIGKAVLDSLSFWKYRPKSKEQTALSLSDSVDIASAPSLPATIETSSPSDTPKTPPLEALEEHPEDGEDSQREHLDSSPNTPPTAEEKRTELEAKIIKECIRLFAHEMYFAYDFDITTPLQRKFHKLTDASRHNQLLHTLANSPESPRPEPLAEPNSNLPLWRRVDRRFWWNEGMVSNFVEAGLHDFVLPLMQGYVQMSTFHSPAPTPKWPRHSARPEGQASDEEDENGYEDIQYTIISRRSRQRAGLRYQRRGVDEQANVANFVETETIIKMVRSHVTNVFSYLQIRGSIPIFWSQPGVNLKPPPKLDRTPSESASALRRHFEKTIKTYGPLEVVNLAEMTGKEAVVTNVYRDLLKEVGIPDTSYHEFDFHKECRGMKYENISKLISALDRSFFAQGFFWVSGAVVLSEQQGVFRVNCIDCLDRTNVVESAFARHVLDQQFQAMALVASPLERHEIDVVVNDVWANNGDAISRAYAGTSALKGDYTRTGRRDLSGMLHDGMNSLARMYTATFTDYFSQAVIDFTLGHRTLSVFSEFMSNMTSTDPRELFRLSKVRSVAIETCTALVVPEGEGEVKAGWTVFSPVRLGVRVSGLFEEKVLLVTSRAFYIVSYDYSLEKVKVFTRIPLGNIIRIEKGGYILSPLQEAGREREQNYGFLVAYRPSDQVETRMTSYTVGNVVSGEDPLSSRGTMESSSSPSPSGSPLLTPSAALLPGSSPSSSHERTERRGSGRSRQLGSMVGASANSELFAAFKSLPVDYTKERVGSEGGYPSGFVRGEKTCEESVGEMCTMLVTACRQVGMDPENLLIERDIVSVTEAERTTPVFAKAEYAIKRLLWLGS